MEFRIVPADMNDFDECVLIAENAWKNGYAEYREILGDDLFGIIFPGWEKAKADAMEPYFNGESELKAYKVYKEDCIAGFITMRFDHSRKVGVICNNAVRPEFQGRGIGTMMYASAISLFRAAGMAAAEVSTMNEDAYKAARKAYERAGFDKKLEKLTYYMKL